MPTIVCVVLFVGLASPAAAGARSDPGAYPLAICAVSGTTLGETQVTADHRGRQIRFCTETCAQTFRAGAAKYLASLDAAILADQTEVYPLDTCVVTGEPLGREGPTFDLIHANRLVKLCCAGCTKAFEKDAAVHIAALDAAVVKEQVDDYPLAACVVSGRKLGDAGEPYDAVVAGRLVRLCCGGCLADLKEDPAAALATLDAASKTSKVDE